jgi:hypothetical protein
MAPPLARTQRTGTRSLTPPGQVVLADYNGSNSAWNLTGFSNSTYPSDQRTHQYIGDHYQKYGTVTLLIDSTCAIGRTTTSFPYDESNYDPSGTNESNSASEDPSC